MSSISDYIEKELGKGKSKKEVRAALKRQGWPDRDVNKAFSEVSGSKAKTVLLVIGLLAIVVTGSILYTFLPDFDDEPEILDEPTEVESSGLDECNSLPYTTEKTSCYTELIEEEQDVCQELTDSRERNFCFSALEDYLLSM